MKLAWSLRHIALALVAVGSAVAIYGISRPLRTSGQKTTCQSNLRQIGLSTMQYVRDYDECFMLAPTWKAALAPYGRFGRQPESILHYVCVTTEREYAYNEGLSSATIGLVNSPENLAMFYEPSRSVNADTGQSWVAKGAHEGGSNVCFHDGHVSWVKNKPTFWTPEIANKAAVKRRRDEEPLRSTQPQTRQWLGAKSQKQQQHTSSP